MGPLARVCSGRRAPTGGIADGTTVPSPPDRRARPRRTRRRGRSAHDLDGQRRETSAPRDDRKGNVARRTARAGSLWTKGASWELVDERRERAVARPEAYSKKYESPSTPVFELM